MSPLATSFYRPVLLLNGVALLAQGLLWLPVWFSTRWEENAFLWFIMSVVAAAVAWFINLSFLLDEVQERREWLAGPLQHQYRRRLLLYAAACLVWLWPFTLLAWLAARSTDAV